MWLINHIFGGAARQNWSNSQRLAENNCVSPEHSFCVSKLICTLLYRVCYTATTGHRSIYSFSWAIQFNILFNDSLMIMLWVEIKCQSEVAWRPHIAHILQQWIYATIKMHVYKWNTKTRDWRENALQVIYMLLISLYSKLKLNH